MMFVALSRMLHFFTGIDDILLIISLDSLFQINFIPTRSTTSQFIHSIADGKFGLTHATTTFSQSVQRH